MISCVAFLNCDSFTISRVAFSNHDHSLLISRPSLFTAEQFSLLQKNPRGQDGFEIVILHMILQILFLSVYRFQELNKIK